ncbi:hypothetical protein GC089_12590 [Cellulomonas sp. JZ18]|uniref:SUKH-3 domain-containing protein n=1 Tax=Cellulomonas sp. JZ18 TaxID=2654191 RepID=UPI0012D45056|nr:SUKH-3 domain-containing protein [Cellulomonas sp. JZ18]QGQ19900.1 hypothetical protein GC089_12590 [Cellulomonas sp. JZ18]
MASSARALLRRAGWSPDREIDVAPVVDRLLGLGYPVFPSLEQFLKEFYGLVVRSEDGTKAITFDLESVQHQTDAEFCREYAAEIGRPLTPVGTHSHMVVMIDAHGGFWGSFDLDYGYKGDDIEQAVRSILIDPPRLFDRRLPD